MVKTPDGIMYLIKKENGIAYCYDDQTGQHLEFLIEEIEDYNPGFPAHTFIYEKITNENRTESSDNGLH